jgi:hypothetical protein
MAVKRMRMLGVSMRKMKALTVKMETVTLIGKQIESDSIKCMKSIVKYFLLAGVLVSGDHLRFG